MLQEATRMRRESDYFKEREMVASNRKNVEPKGWKSTKKKLVKKMEKRELTLTAIAKHCAVAVNTARRWFKEEYFPPAAVVNELKALADGTLPVATEAKA